MSSDFLKLADVLAIHEDLISQYGGSHGLRDAGQLEAALFRPQSGYYDDIIAQASALWESLSQNHPFIDGNKRVAFASMLVFLEINNVTITANENEVWEFLSALYAKNNFSFEIIDVWLRQNTQLGIAV